MTQPKRLAYLLRIWQQNSDGPWRLTLQASDGQRHHFEQVEHLIEFIDSITESASDTPESAGSSA